jgi:hypothetical protein
MERKHRKVLLIAIAALLTAIWGCQSPRKGINQGSNLPNLVVKVEGMDESFAAFATSAAEFSLTECINAVGQANYETKEVVFSHRELKAGQVCKMQVRSASSSLAGFTDQKGEGVYFESPGFPITKKPDGGLIGNAPMVPNAIQTADLTAADADSFTLTASFQFPNGIKIEEASDLNAWLLCSKPYGQILSVDIKEQNGSLATLEFSRKRALTPSISCSRALVSFSDKSKGDLWFEASLNAQFSNLKGQALTIGADKPIELKSRLTPNMASAVEPRPDGSGSKVFIEPGKETYQSCSQINTQWKTHWFDWMSGQCLPCTFKSDASDSEKAQCKK